MTPLRTLIENHPFTRGLPASHVKSLLDCARDCHIKTGQLLWRQGDAADEFFLIRSGEVGLGISIPGEGWLQVETVGSQEVLGWSWILAPHRWHFDALAITSVGAICFDAKRLRNLLERDQGLHFALLLRIAPVVAKRLEASHLKLLELRGTAAPSSSY